MIDRIIGNDQPARYHEIRYHRKALIVQLLFAINEAEGHISDLVEVFKEIAFYQFNTSLKTAQPKGFPCHYNLFRKNLKGLQFSAVLPECQGYPER